MMRWTLSVHILISIHALRKESDLQIKGLSAGPLTFQSTLSVRRATFLFTAPGEPLDISIHALRKESDARNVNTSRSHNISIHALRKESDHAASGEKHGV